MRTDLSTQLFQWTLAGSHNIDKFQTTWLHGCFFPKISHVSRLRTNHSSWLVSIILSVKISLSNPYQELWDKFPWHFLDVLELQYIGFTDYQIIAKLKFQLFIEMYCAYWRAHISILVIKFEFNKVLIKF